MRNALLVLIAACALGACAERDQEVAQQAPEKRYQGRSDGKPWDNDPIAYESAKWTKGDRASWETQIKTRQQGQNEDRRIYQ